MSRKVAGSIPDGVIGIFHCHYPSDRTMALRSTQPLNRNEQQENFLGGKGGLCVGLTTLSPSCAECHEIREPHPSRTLRACPRIALPLLKLRGQINYLMSSTFFSQPYGLRDNYRKMVCTIFRLVTLKM